MHNAIPKQFAPTIYTSIQRCWKSLSRNSGYFFIALFWGACTGQTLAHDSLTELSSALELIETSAPKAAVKKIAVTIPKVVPPVDLKKPATAQSLEITPENINKIKTADGWVKFFGKNVTDTLEEAIQKTPLQKEAILAATAKTLNQIIATILDPDDVKLGIPEDPSITPEQAIKVLNNFIVFVKGKYTTILSLFSLDLTIDKFKENETFNKHIQTSRLFNLLANPSSRGSDPYETTVKSFVSMRNYGVALVQKIGPMLEKIELKSRVSNLNLKMYETALFLDKISSTISTEFQKASEKLRGKLDELIIKDENGLICSQKPQGIGNAKGTCFLNADLQLWRTIYCIPEAYQEMQYDIMLPAQNPHFKRNLSLKFKEFMNAYAEGKSSKSLEKFLEAIEKELYQIDSRLDLGTDACPTELIQSGRTHRVMEIIAKSLTQHLAIIDCSKNSMTDFESAIGCIVNSLDGKNKFNTDLDILKQTLKARGTLADIEPAINFVVGALKRAQQQGAYLAIEIARAVSLEVVLGISPPFKWPQILIISTTREVDGKYKKLGNDESNDPQAQEVDRLMTIVKKEDLIKFKTQLKLSEYGFQPNQQMKTPAPNYNLIAFSAKIPGHAMSVIKRGNVWYTCTNSDVAVVTEAMDEAAKKGSVKYFDFGKNQKAIPEILVYEKAT